MKDYNSIYKWQNRKISNSVKKSKKKDKVIDKNFRYGLLLEISITCNSIVSSILDRLYKYNRDAYYGKSDNSCYMYDIIHWEILENSDTYSYYNNTGNIFFVLKSGKLGIFIEKQSYVREFEPYITGEVKELKFTSGRMRKFILPIKRARALYIEKDKGMELDENNFKLRYKIRDYLIRSKSYSAGISERMADLE
jgi:hypothetical protein